MKCNIKYILPGTLILLSQTNIALTAEKSNFDGFDISLGISNVKLESSNNLSGNSIDLSGNSIDLSGNFISPSNYSFEDDKQMFNLGLSYTRSLNANYNVSYNIEFSPNTINANYSGVGLFSQTDEISNLLRSSFQLGYLFNPGLQIGLKAGLTKADSKNIRTFTRERNLNGKSLGIVAKKNFKDNLFLNLEYSQISFDNTQIDNELDLELFTLSISYKFK